MNAAACVSLLRAAAVLASLAMVVRPHSSAAETEKDAASARPPRISPDYTGVVLPPNIAPLNFTVAEPGKRYRVTIRSAAGRPIELSSRDPSVAIPAKAWKELLRANTGQALYVDVAVQTAEGTWTTFGTITNTIAREDIDGFLVYRLLKPLFNIYHTMGIYQRNLETFEETEVLANTRIDSGCLNCHTFLNHSPRSMSFNVRSITCGNPMILVRNGEVARTSFTAGYMSWHPSGRLIAFSKNKLTQFFHTVGECRDVFDAESSLAIYRVDSNVIVNPPSIAQPEMLETWPSWSPDGRHLYFCSAPKLPQERFREVRYSLMRVAYDLEKDSWGALETLVSAEQTGRSAAQPRVSPDGRYLLFCICKYGSFPIYQQSSDLFLMDLTTRQYRRLEINSEQSESWHCWSSNSRWIVFSSKRLDGLFARPHFSYVDEQGKVQKPFILPQKDPAFYDSFIKTYNVPELIREPVAVKPEELARAVVAPARTLTPEGAQPQEKPHTGDEGGAEKPGYDEGTRPSTAKSRPR
ncbi:MAG: cytochrome C biosynthesis protein [Planctomycetota bacterium]|nr:cytochrome C biosynthesis protein [Planctomycetota bacterium]